MPLPLRRAVLVALVTALLSACACAQSYIPLVTQLTFDAVRQCTSFAKLGVDTLSRNYESTPLRSGSVYLSAYTNASVFGASLTQLSLQLADSINSGSGPSARLGVYILGQQFVQPIFGTGTLLSQPATLLAQTDEITVWPSLAQTLYANLLTPALLLSSGQYALGVWTDNSLTLYSGGHGAAYTATAGYNNFAMPAQVTATTYSDAFSSGALIAQAAMGCRDPNLIATAAAAGTAYYALCGYVEQYSPSPSTTDYTQVSSTVLTSFSALVGVSTTATTTSFGSGMKVTSLLGDLTVSTAGYTSILPDVATTPYTFTLSSTNKVAAASPSNVVYPSGAAVVDGSGLTLLMNNGLQFLLQWNAATKQYQLLNSSAPAAGNVVLSSVTLTPVTSTSQPVLFNCSLPPTSYTPPALPACPAGSLSWTFGDNTGDLTDTLELEYDSSFISGNTLYLRPIAFPAASTLVQSLSTPLLANPGTVIHLRMGLYALNGSISSPSWTLLGQTAEQVVVNPAATTITAPLTTNVTVGAGTYALGVWYDTSVFTYQMFWESSPALYSLKQPYTSVSATGSMPATATPTFDFQTTPVQATVCILGVTTTVAFSFCAAFITSADTQDLYTGVLTALPNTTTNAFGTYWTVIGVSGTQERYDPYCYESDSSSSRSAHSARHTAAMPSIAPCRRLD